MNNINIAQQGSVFNGNSDGRYCYVQERPAIHSPRRAALDATAKRDKRPYRIKERNPRTSFEGWQGWASKEAAVTNRYLESLPVRYVVCRGCLKLHKNALPSDHRKAKALFTRAIKAGEKKTGGIVRFRAVADHSDKYNRHWDYVLYSDLDYNKVRKIVKDAAAKAGFVVASCQPIGAPGSRRGWVNYQHKTKMMMQTGQKYVYLPAKDGSRLIWNSQDFFIGTTAKQLWDELKEEWNKKAPPITSFTNISTTPPLDELDQLHRFTAEVASVLPSSADDADSQKWTVAKLNWQFAGRMPPGLNPESALFLHPDLQVTKNGCYWIKRATPIPPSSTGSKVPYHASFNPILEDPHHDEDEPLDRILCCWEDFAGQVQGKGHCTARPNAKGGQVGDGIVEMFVNEVIGGR